MENNTTTKLIIFAMKSRKRNRSHGCIAKISITSFDQSCHLRTITGQSLLCCQKYPGGLISQHSRMNLLLLPCLFTATIIVASFWQ